MKRLKSLLTAAAMMLSLCGGVLPQNAALPVSAETGSVSAEADSCASFDEETGTLTL